MGIFDTFFSKKQVLILRNIELTPDILELVLEASEINEIEVLAEKIDSIDTQWITAEQIIAVEQTAGQTYKHKWQFDHALAAASPEWQMRKNEKNFNKDLKRKLSYLYHHFRKQ